MESRTECSKEDKEVSTDTWLQKLHRHGRSQWRGEETIFLGEKENSRINKCVRLAQKVENRKNYLVRYFA